MAYAKIHANPKTLNSLLKIAETFKVSKNDTNTYRAFWINAYNLSVIKGIINHYPTTSPLAHPGFFDKTTYYLAGKSITINAIENQMLRTVFKDARFHFVLVCGAKGCPPIINKAYMPDTVETLLNQQTKLALNSNSFIKLNDTEKSFKTSEILKWYKVDFTMNGSSEIDFINRFRTEKIPANYTLSYFPYDWNLNSQ